MTDSDVPVTNTLAHNSDNWPQLLEQWKQARRPLLPRPLRHASTGLLFTIALMLFYGGTIVAAIMYRLWPKFVLFQVMQFTFMSVAAGLMFAAAGRSATLPAAQKRLVERLNALKDAHAIGSLLELLFDAATQAERDALQKALTNVLPQVRPAGGEALTVWQRYTLYQAITPQTAERDNDFFLACLDAVDHIGDGDALVPLTRVIVADAPTHAQQIARDRARQCRDTLLSRLDFGTVSSVSAWLDRLPEYVPFSGTFPADLERHLVPIYALTRLLPLLTSADAALLTPRNRQTLTWAHRLMLSLFVVGNNRNNSVNVEPLGRLDPDFELAVLDALAQIGTGDDAAHVRALTHDGSTAYNRAVRAKARQVLPLLEARLEKEQMGRTLLRGASAPPTSEKELLRAASDAHTASATRHEELLRPQTVTPACYQATQTSEEQINNTLKAGL